MNALSDAILGQGAACLALLAATLLLNLARRARHLRRRKAAPPAELRP